MRNALGYLVVGAQKNQRGDDDEEVEAVEAPIVGIREVTNWMTSLTYYLQDRLIEDNI